MRRIAALKIAAFIPLAMAVTVLLILGLRQSALGNWSGLTLLVPALTVFLLMAFSWRQPLLGGLLMCLAAAAQVLLWKDSFLIPGDKLWQPVILPAVLAAAGIVLVIVGVLESIQRKRARARMSRLPHRHPPEDSGPGPAA
ncbi:MAG: hypothetical protein ACM3QS_15550 [Bacteroidota bacterium]